MIQLKILFQIIFLLIPLRIKTNQQKGFSKYFFNMYPSKGSQTPYILHVNTPSSEKLKIDFSKIDEENVIIKETSTDYANPNISSVFFYEDEYLVKTCFGSNKLVEIIPQKEMETINENSKYVFSSDDINISNNLVYCYSTTINNPVKTITDSKAIITYWVEINSIKEYNHKCVLFYPISKKYSNIYTLYSSSSVISNRYPAYCTTFRETDIFCSYYNQDLNNQFVIETDKIVLNSKTQPSIYFVLSDFGQINGNNMKPVALNKQMKSIFGGYYDVFLAEFHNNDRETKSTVLLYSLYRKSLHTSIVPMFANLELFFGTNIRGAYIENNLFSYLLEPDEVLLFFIYKNDLQVVRVDYSVQNNLFKNFSEIQNLGNYSIKLNNCSIPKYMQTTYITNLIKYDSLDQSIVNENVQYHYIYQQDISVLLSCSDSDVNEEVKYDPILIRMPQCLNYLDSIHGNGIHFINFYLSFNTIIYDIYSDPRLKSFRNVGIMFYPYEKYYMGLIFLQIKLRSDNNYIVPKNNVIYNDIAQIRFQRIIPKYVPYFVKPFYLKYRLFNNDNSNLNIKNNLSSNICFFQIRFFPFDIYEKQTEGKDTTTTDTTLIEPDTCNIPYCAVCIKDTTNDFICEKCDTSEIEVIIKDDNEESNTYGQCICDTNLGFYKDLDNNMCICQDNFAYYRSTNLCRPLKELKDGPYYTNNTDDVSEIPIYNDCYFSCKKCSKGGDENNHNCDECKEGYAYIDDNENNCYDEDELKEGYHEVEPGHYIKCHENCISCDDKPIINQENEVIYQHCTECKNYVPYFIRENPDDIYFNCFEKNVMKMNQVFYLHILKNHMNVLEIVIMVFNHIIIPKYVY